MSHTARRRQAVDYRADISDKPNRLVVVRVSVVCGGGNDQNLPKLWNLRKCLKSGNHRKQHFSSSLASGTINSEPTFQDHSFVAMMEPPLLAQTVGKGVFTSW